MIQGGNQEFASPEEALQHFGVKGMRWGVRNERPQKEQIKSLVTETTTRTTSNGDTFTLTPKNPSAVTQFLARHIPRHRKLVESSAMINITDKKGATIGNLQVYAVSKKEMNITWIDIEESQRGRGYAQAVMHSTEEIGRQKGFEKLTLEVPGISPDARHIYEKQGFKVTKEPSKLQKENIWGGLTEMEKKLD